MSELDFEDEMILFEKEEQIKNDESLAKKLSANSKQNIVTQDEIHRSRKYECDEEIKQIRNEIISKVMNNVSDGDIKLDGGEMSENPDLEDGEIKDPSSACDDDDDNKAICRYFSRGTCHHGKECRFIHVGLSAYHMFDNVSRKRVMPFMSVYHPPVYYHGEWPVSQYPQPLETSCDAWERGLHEVKRMLLKARYKRENDIEFEDKKLHLRCEEERSLRNNTKFFSKNEKYRASSPADDFKPIGTTASNPRKEVKLKKSDKCYPQDWVDPWRRSRSRTRRSISCSSLSSSGHQSRSSSSQCSMCSSVSSRLSSAKKRDPKGESKLVRAFSRTFPKALSNKRSLSRSCSPSCSLSGHHARKKSLSSFYGADLPPDHSSPRSSSGSRYSKKHAKKYLSSSSLPKSKRSGSSDRKTKESHRLKRRRSPMLERKAKSPPRTESRVFKRKHSPLASTLKHKAKSPPHHSGDDSSNSDMIPSSIARTSFSPSSVHTTSVKTTKSLKSIDCAEPKFKNKKSDPDSFKKGNDKNFDDVKNVYSSKKVKSSNGDKSEFPNVTTSKMLQRSSETLPKTSQFKQFAIKKPVKRIFSSAELELLKYQPFRKQNNLTKAPIKGPTPALKKKTFKDSLINYPSKTQAPKQKMCEAISSNYPKKSIHLNLIPKSNIVSSKSVNSGRVLKSPEKKIPLSKREKLLQQLQAIELAIAKKKQL